MLTPNILDETKSSATCNGECENCGGCDNSSEEIAWDRMEAECLDEEERMFDSFTVKRICEGLD